MHPNVIRTSSPVDEDVLWLCERVVEFFGHGSQEARVAARIKRKAETVNVENIYEKKCPSCRCPVCGKTRSEAARIARGKRRRNVPKSAGHFLEQSLKEDDVLLSLSDRKSTGFTVLDLGIAQVKASEYHNVNR